MIITSSWPSAAATARHLGPVAAAHGHHLVDAPLVHRDALGGTGRGQVVGLAGLDHGHLELAHVLVQPPLYRLVSGGGMWAPMYSTSTPPSG